MVRNVITALTATKTSNAHQQRARSSGAKARTKIPVKENTPVERERQAIEAGRFYGGSDKRRHEVGNHRLREAAQQQKGAREPQFSRLHEALRREADGDTDSNVHHDFVLVVDVLVELLGDVGARPRFGRQILRHCCFWRGKQRAGESAAAAGETWRAAAYAEVAGAEQNEAKPEQVANTKPHAGGRAPPRAPDNAASGGTWSRRRKQGGWGDARRCAHQQSRSPNTVKRTTCTVHCTRAAAKEDREPQMSGLRHRIRRAFFCSVARSRRVRSNDTTAL